MNLQQHITEWLDSIGADGLMYPGPGHTHCHSVEEALRIVADAYMLVPAYRHADGCYHQSPETRYPCDKCDAHNERGCIFGNKDKCLVFKSWLSHKREAK